MNVRALIITIFSPDLSLKSCFFFNTLQLVPDLCFNRSGCKLYYETSLKRFFGIVCYRTLFFQHAKNVNLPKYLEGPVQRTVDKSGTD